jgi:hypothetical protein
MWLGRWHNTVFVQSAGQCEVIQVLFKEDQSQHAHIHVTLWMTNLARAADFHHLQSFSQLKKVKGNSRKSTQISPTSSWMAEMWTCQGILLPKMLMLHLNTIAGSGKLHFLLRFLNYHPSSNISLTVSQFHVATLFVQLEKNAPVHRVNDIANFINVYNLITLLILSLRISW